MYDEFGFRHESRPKLWNSAKMMKFSENYEILLKYRTASSSDSSIRTIWKKTQTNNFIDELAAGHKSSPKTTSADEKQKVIA